VLTETIREWASGLRGHAEFALIRTQAGVVAIAEKSWAREALETRFSPTTNLGEVTGIAAARTARKIGRG